MAAPSPNEERTMMRDTKAERASKAGLRLVVGIDGSAGCDYALELARRLDFRVPQHYVLVNAIESNVPLGTFPAFRYEQGQTGDVDDREAAGMARLHAALPKISDRDANAEELQAHGEPSGVLMRIAREEKADLVVVGHNRRDPLDDLLFGSVARTLLRECPQHVLAARPPARAEEGLIAVLATDDSPESERCVEAFLRIDPKGLERVVVLTVNEIDSGAAAILVRGLPHLQRKAEGWIAEGLRTDVRALCARLQAAGFDAEQMIVEGTDPALAISRICDATRASLLIVAARPHGFWDRLLNGSVTEKLLEQDARSLLVLRP